MATIEAVPASKIADLPDDYVPPFQHQNTANCLNPELCAPLTRGDLPFREYASTRLPDQFSGQRAPIDYFRLLLNNDIIDILVTETNRYAAYCQSKMEP